MNPIQIEFDATVPLTLRSQVANWYERQVPGRLQLKPEDRLRTMDAGTISGIAGAFISAIALIIEIVQIQGRNRWDADRVLRAVKEALMRHGVADYEITNVIGYEEFENSQSGACRINVLHTKQQNAYAVSICRDGAAYVLRLDE